MEKKRITGAMLRVLEIVAGEGATAAQVAKELGIRVSAARKHLEKLELYGFVKHVFVRKGVGRPRKVYMVTEEGIEALPKIYGEMLVEIMDRLSALGLRNRIEDIVESMAIEIASKNRSGDLRESVEKLNSLGFMSSIKIDRDRIEVVSRNCPVLKAAKRHFDIFCTKFHTKAISMLANSYRVELAECIARGDLFCRHILLLSPQKSG
ncbi:hypothetical protein ATG_11290 [Desulfurococcaceae archaeon AG1]|jgi:predicted ArsR family transcriptional regulator|nr:MAG: hypothetical protein DJ555_08150 [Desulfurococcaceae archaeon]GAY25926.1 hypothetical protein ATG_11290 [Desulfurococcaceae archaeon AG1]